MYSITVHTNGQKHSTVYFMYMCTAQCTCNIKKTIKQGKYMSQEKIISLILLHYIRKLKEAKM